MEPDADSKVPFIEINTMNLVAEVSIKKVGLFLFRVDVIGTLFGEL